MTDVKPAKDQVIVKGEVDKLLPIEAEAQEAAHGHKHEPLPVAVHRSRNDPGIFVVTIGDLDISSIVVRDSTIIHSDPSKPMTVTLTLAPEILEVWL